MIGMDTVLADIPCHHSTNKNKKYKYIIFMLDMIAQIAHSMTQFHGAA